MKIIDMDTDRALQPITVRERIAMRILYMMLNIVMPYKYKHQFDEFIKEFWN